MCFDFGCLTFMLVLWLPANVIESSSHNIDVGRKHNAGNNLGRHVLYMMTSCCDEVEHLIIDQYVPLIMKPCFIYNMSLLLRAMALMLVVPILP